MLIHHSINSFASAVQDFYNGSDDKFFWKLDRKCDNEISVEYPNILVKRCSFESTDEKRSVKWCSPFSISPSTDSVDTKVNFVISFDKSISGDNCESEYIFKSINVITSTEPASTTIDGQGRLVLYSEAGITTYSTEGLTPSLVVSLVDHIGWYDLVFEFTIDGELCNVEGFDYCIELDGKVNSYKKNNCHKSRCNKLKINYSSYITLEKVE